VGELAFDRWSENFVTMKIDSHQHFWRFSEAEYGWMKPDWPIRRDYFPSDLEPELRACGLDGCVAVQARQSLEESRWLLELAESSAIIRGVVGWVDLRCDKVEEQLRSLSVNDKFVGVRHVVQDEPDDSFMLGESFQRGIGLLKNFGLTYDILIYPRQLPAAIRLVENFPNQPFVLDHIAKPFIKDGTIEPWKTQIRELADHPNVCCKISGMVTEADWRSWKSDQFQPYLETVLDAFGIDRLMYGSDWPVALLAGSYRQVYQLTFDFVSPLGHEAIEKFFGTNCTRFYGLT
jgi:L-fuconolactonase